MLPEIVHALGVPNTEGSAEEVKTYTYIKSSLVYIFNAVVELFSPLFIRCFSCVVYSYVYIFGFFIKR